MRKNVERRMGALYLLAGGSSGFPFVARLLCRVFRTLLFLFEEEEKMQNTERENGDRH
jgi:hypothetical protein